MKFDSSTFVESISHAVDGKRHNLNGLVVFRDIFIVWMKRDEELKHW